MKNRLRMLSLLFLMSASCLALSAHHAQAAEGRETRKINFDWRFVAQDVAGAQAADFDDAAWRKVDLPHDFSIEGAFSQQWASGTGYLPGGIGWYRKALEIPAELKDKQVGILFEGVYKNAEVWCNGARLGKRPYGYISFYYDLTPHIRFGGRNVIAVRVDHHDFADSRWYTGSGIYRNVFLTVTDKVHVQPWGIFVTTPQVTRDAARVVVQTSVANRGAAAARVQVLSEVRDAGGNVMVAAREAQALAGASEATVTQMLSVGTPQLWSPAQPVMYELVTRVISGPKVLDEVHTPFGIRSFRFDPDKGFFLNGESMKIKGVCVHHDAGALGAAVPVKVWERRLNLLKDAGCNAIRMSHNPPAPELLDLCDRMGFLVQDEAFDEWTQGKHKWVAGRNKGEPSLDGYNRDFAEWAETDARDMVRRDRNHPSIIMWSIGNEIDYPRDPFPPNTAELRPVARRLVKAVKSADTTRPVSAACAGMPGNLFWPELDIVGYNYQEQLYAADHQKDPRRVIYGSENGHRLNAWLAVRDNDFISAQFLWTGVDFLGEANAWPNRGSRSGLLDLAGFRKPNYFMRQSLWAGKPMVHIEAGAEYITGYTNCDRVELFKDDRSLGEKAPGSNHTIFWGLDFTKGTLRAVGKKAGQEVCSDELKAAGAPAQLVLQSDSKTLAADGEDVAQIEVNVTDAAGTRVPEAGDLVTCEFRGPGRILGIENGDQQSHESYQAPTHHAYQGRMLIYLRADRETAHNGDRIELKISAAGLKGASEVIEVKR